MSRDPSWDCGGESQTMIHFVNDCPLPAFLGGLVGLHNLQTYGLKWTTA